MRTRALHLREPAGDVRFCLVFPREAISIPVMRQVLGDTLTKIGVDPDCVLDLLIAATEACTNVLRHAGPGLDGYELVVQAGRDRCTLQVLDNGRGYESAARSFNRRRPPVRPVSLLRRRARATDVARLPESGRGLAIMRACVDDVSLRGGPGRGTVVQLRKRIEWRDDSPLVHQGDWALRDAG
jgi:serine/threonine-protein kinase RsbW